VSDSIPKPMINIGPYPILWHIMNHYASFGHKEFILCLGYKSDVIKDFFLNLRAHTSDLSIDFATGTNTYHTDLGRVDWNVTLAETGLNTMTGGRIKRIAKYLKPNETFMLTYGDGVGNVDLDRLVAFHKTNKKVLTVTGVRPPGRFGELMANSTGLVEEFNEKPQSTGGRISGGFFVCESKLMDYIPDTESCVFEQDPVRSMVRDRQMMIYEHDGFWQPMDTHREYSLLNELYAKGSAPWIHR
ncbi:MAG: glucose-1-phosphate cytidylyltransferase, partial [Proteobacteria bacterium]|nr:glucose-1-phosphate cytidylyltransferase [Pseudomonadota bacterium]